MADLLERRAPFHYPELLKRLVGELSFVPLELKGSAGLTAQQYPSDFDLFGVVPRGHLGDLLTGLGAFVGELPADVWFVELKAQTKAPVRKLRLTDVGGFSKWAARVKKLARKLDFIKIDLIARNAEDSQFSEVSCIYSTLKSAQSLEDYAASLADDIRELTAEGKFYKVLKRQFNLTKAKPASSERTARLKQLTKYFNGAAGERYQLLNRLDAIKQVIELDPSSEAAARVAVKNLHLPAEAQTDLDAWVVSAAKKLNDEAAKLVAAHPQ